MFDDWVVPIVAEAPKRKRAVSLAQSVARAPHDNGEISGPQVRSGLDLDGEMDLWGHGGFASRPRSSSLSKLDTPHSVDSDDLGRWMLDHPLTRKQLLEVDNPRQWLGGSYDPATIGFDALELEAHTSSARQVMLECDLAADLVGDFNSEAAAIGAEIESTQAAFDAVAHRVATLKVSTTSTSSDSALIQGIEEYLHWFDILDTATNRLGQPAPRIVRDFAAFESLVADLRLGLDWCKQHSDFADMDLYELRFRQCLERADAVAAAWVTHELHRVESRLLPKLVQPSSVQQALVWTKFRNDAEHIAPAAQLVRRSAENIEAKRNDKNGDRPDPGTWVKLQRTYFDIRSNVLGAEIARYTANVQPGTPSFLEGGLQTALAEFRELYDREKQVWEVLMGPPPTPDFVAWLGDISDGLYSALRRYIVHEQDIGRLCQLLMALQGTAAAQPEWEPVFGAIIRDAQNRLVFRADLEIDSLGSTTPTGSPVVRTLRLLEQVYHLLNHKVFNDLAHRCIRECLTAMRVDSTKPGTAQGSTGGRNEVESQCRIIGQLLQLQSSITEFDLEHSIEYEVDFSGFHALITSLPKQRSLQALMDLAATSVPRVVETMLDAMEEVYGELRQAADRLVSLVVQLATTPLQSPVTADQAQSKSGELRDRVLTEYESLRSLLDKHVSEPKAVEALLGNVQDGIMKRYSDWYATLVVSVTDSDSLDGLMDPEMLGVWLGEAAS